MNKDEALKLALEAAYLAGFNDSGEGYNGEYPFRDHCASPLKDHHWILRRDEYIQKALAQPEQETVLPGGGHVPAVPVAVYGYCPECGGAGVMRERKPGGDDKCTNGHKYPSSKALAQPEQGSVAYWHKEFLKHNTTSDQPEQEPVIDKSAAIRIATALGWEPKRKPLTDDEIHAIYDEVARREPYNMAVTRRNIARGIEAAHGIKGDA